MWKTKKNKKRFRIHKYVGGSDATNVTKDSEKRTGRVIDLMLAPIGFKILMRPVRTYPVTI